ncbi:hypothetical protein [Ideonella sp. B508-1]|uniref:hypothetical protein n=1 Tax=Ideonella sp. B508-1 TaxID=137716 RepID=UPI0003B5AC84|nr:hypothetical protein [Ideonella sp. B508-1]
MGFRKTARRSQRTTAQGLVQTVVLESGPRSPYSPYRFDIELRVTHPELPPNRCLINLGCCKHIEGQQRWVVGVDDGPEVWGRILSVLREKAPHLLARMASVEGLTAMFEEISSVWYYESQAWCLERLGFHDQAVSVIQRAIEQAPHEGFREAAERKLAQYQVP